jgi:hypothetical protein
MKQKHTGGGERRRRDYRRAIQVTDMQFVIPRRGYEVWVDLETQGGEIKHDIPYTGSERICWDCETQRHMVLSFDLKGKLVEYYDLCESVG